MKILLVLVSSMLVASELKIDWYKVSLEENLRSPRALEWLPGSVSLDGLRYYQNQLLETHTGVHRIWKERYQRLGTRSPDFGLKNVENLLGRLLGPFQ